MNINDCTVCILAGGLGSRLKKVIMDQQKVIAEINGTNVLRFILDQLSKDGFKDVFLLTGYKSKQVKDSLRNYSSNIDLNYSEEKNPLGTGGAVKFVSKKIKKDFLLVINGDTIIDFSRKKFIENIRDDRETMLSVHIKNVSRYGELIFDNKMEVIKMNEKTGIKRGGYINAGTYILKRQNILKFEKRIFSLENDYFQHLIKKRSLYSAPFEFDFLDIGIPNDYKKAKDLIK